MLYTYLSKIISAIFLWQVVQAQMYSMA